MESGTARREWRSVFASLRRTEESDQHNSRGIGGVIDTVALALLLLMVVHLGMTTVKPDVVLYSFIDYRLIDETGFGGYIELLKTKLTSTVIPFLLSPFSSRLFVIDSRILELS